MTHRLMENAPDFLSPPKQSIAPQTSRLSTRSPYQDARNNFEGNASLESRESNNRKNTQGMTLNMFKPTSQREAKKNQLSNTLGINSKMKKAIATSGNSKSPLKQNIIQQNKKAISNVSNLSKIIKNKAQNKNLNQTTSKSPLRVSKGKKKSVMTQQVPEPELSSPDRRRQSFLQSYQEQFMSFSAISSQSGVPKSYSIPQNHSQMINYPNGPSLDHIRQSMKQNQIFNMNNYDQNMFSSDLISNNDQYSDNSHIQKSAPRPRMQGTSSQIQVEHPSSQIISGSQSSRSYRPQNNYIDMSNLPSDTNHLISSQQQDNNQIQLQIENNQIRNITMAQVNQRNQNHLMADQDFGGVQVQTMPTYMDQGLNYSGGLGPIQYDQNQQRSEYVLGSIGNSAQTKNYYENSPYEKSVQPTSSQGGIEPPPDDGLTEEERMQLNFRNSNQQAQQTILALRKQLKDKNLVISKYEGTFSLMSQKLKIQSEQIKHLKLSQETTKRYLKQIQEAKQNQQNQRQKTPERIFQLLKEVQDVKDQVNEQFGETSSPGLSKSPSKKSMQQGGKLSQIEIQKIQQMVTARHLSQDEHKIFEKLLVNLSSEQQMRLKSEEQHSQMVDQLVRNQVKLEQQLKNFKDRNGNAKRDGSVYLMTPSAISQESPDRGFSTINPPELSKSAEAESPKSTNLYHQTGNFQNLLR